MTRFYVDKTINKIVVETDDPSLAYFFETESSKVEYVPWKKAWINVKKKVKIYDHKKSSGGVTSYKFGLGWAAYLCNVLTSHISQADYEGVIKEAILSENPRTTPFRELRDYQNEDVLHILKYKVGLFNVYTSYGKFI